MIRRVSDWVAALVNRARELPRRQHLADELEEEMRYHRALLERDERLRGAGADDARLAAQRRFGNETYLREESRTMWSFVALETLGQDVRYAVRFLRRSPAFVAVAVLSLALGIGANTAIFTLIDTVLVRALPVRDPQSLVLLEKSRNGTDTSGSWSFPAFTALRDQNGVLAGLFASTSTGSLEVRTGNGEATAPSSGLLVTGQFFATLGVLPQIGRLLTPDDDRVPGGHPVAVLSDAYWRRALGGDASVVGRGIAINGTPFTIVGITPPEFFGTQVGANPDVYLPMMMDSVANRSRSLRNNRGDWWMEVMGRLRPGVTRSRAAFELSALFRRDLIANGADESPQTREGYSRAAVVLSDASNGLAVLRRRFSKPLWVIAAMSGLVLLVACSNLASLLLARAAARQREMAIRLSLGAGRRRLLRQLLTESAILSFIGAALGLVFAYVGDRALLAIAQVGRTSLAISVTPDGRVLAFTLAIAVLTSVMFGVAPALQATRVALAPALREGATVGGARPALRLGKFFVVTQVAFSVLLLFGAGLFVRSLQRIYAVDVGFRHDRTLLVRVNPRRNGYDGARSAGVYDRIIDRLGAVPGVRAVTAASQSPFQGPESSFGARIEGFDSPPDRLPSVTRLRVGLGYFGVLGIPLRAGRLLEPGDIGSAQLPRGVVVNETFARRYAGGGNPVGRRIFPGQDGNASMEIVGVVRDSRFNSYREDTPPIAYFLMGADTARLGSGTFILQLDPGVPTMAALIRSAITSIDPRLEVLSIRFLDAQIASTVSNERVVASLSTVFGVLALVLAMVGLYGVMTYSVTRRTRELGLRIALGAGRRDVVGLVLREVFALVAGGVVVGIPIALAVGRLGAALLYDLSPTDPSTLALAVSCLAATGLAAGLVPARRASRVDPLTALRVE
jgi:predicted permease